MRARVINFLLAGLVAVGIILFVWVFFVNKKADQIAAVADTSNKRTQTEILVRNLLLENMKNAPDSDLLVTKIFYESPPAVEKVRNESMVPVEFMAPRMAENKITVYKSGGVGFVVDDKGSIITAMHTMNDVPADWFSPMTTIRVHNGQDFFSVEINKYDWIIDLVMLKVKDWEKNKKKFSKQPAVIASATDKVNLENFEHTYSFYFTVAGSKVFTMPLILGPYLQESNIRDEKGQVAESKMSGVVNGRIDSGFSGGPLLGPDGKVYGVLKQTTDTHTFSVTVEDLLTFIRSDQETIDKRLLSAQESKSR